MFTSQLPLSIQTIRIIYLIRALRGGKRIALLSKPNKRSKEYIVENDGTRFRCDLKSYLEWHLAALKDYEWAEKRIFSHLFPTDRRNLLLDVGSNIGIHSLHFSKTFSRILAFEPNPDIYKRLVYNIELNPERTIHPVNIGLGDEENRITFYQPAPDFSNQGTGTFDLTSAPERYVEVALPIRPGDAYMREAGVDRIDGIKIDVQGYEVQVLSGLREIIEKSRPAIWAEFSATTIQNTKNRGGIDNIIPRGYKKYKFSTQHLFGIIHRTSLKEVAEPSIEAQGDYVFLPEEWPLRP